jgi:hypothetical protein
MRALAARQKKTAIPEQSGSDHCTYTGKTEKKTLEVKPYYATKLKIHIRNA